MITTEATTVAGAVPVRAVVVGVAVGAVTLVLRLHLPAPWDLLGSSFGVWCLVPFLAGGSTGGLRTAAVAGAAASTGMNAGYYAALTALTGRVEDAGVVAFWVLVAAAVGTVMAAAALSSARCAAGWAALACLPGAVCVLEALPVSGLHALDGPGGELLQRGWIAAGILLSAALAVRSPVRSRAPARVPVPVPARGHSFARPLVAVSALPVAVLVSGGCWALARQVLALIAPS